MSEEDLRAAAEALVIICLRELIRRGRVTLDDVNSRWHVSIRADKLGERGLAGAVTLDTEGRVVLYLRPDLTVEALLNVIAHEVVHLVQMCCGDLLPMRGFQIWRDEPYPTLSSDDPLYYIDQPWEVEAEALQPTLLHLLRMELTGNSP